MIVFVDVGNTRIKWCSTNMQVTALAIGEWQSQLPVWRQMGVTQVWVSCVAGLDWQQEFVAACEQQLKLSPHFARVKNEVDGLKLAYTDLNSLGVDRWLAMLAANKQLRSGTGVVLSAGSAITVDFIQANQHLGGLIVPGIQMSIAALDRGTGRIGLQLGELPAPWQAGSSTQACVLNGVSALLHGLLQQISEHSVWCEPNTRLMLCGGNAPNLIAMLPEGMAYDLHPYLVLEGLALLFSNG